MEFGNQTDIGGAESQALNVLRHVFKLASENALELTDLLTVTDRLVEAGNIPLAVDLFRSWLARTTSPQAFLIWYQLGIMLARNNDLGSAEGALRHCYSLCASFKQSAFALGQILEQQGKVNDAIGVWQEASSQSDNVDIQSRDVAVSILNNLGRLLEDQRQYFAAEQTFGRSLILNPDQPIVLGERIRLRQYLCAWPIEDAAAGLSAQAFKEGIKSFSCLSAYDDPHLQLAAARRFLEHPFKLETGLKPLADRKNYGHDRLRIGYLSSDFRWHAVSLLTAELFELHDRSRVEVFGFCWTKEELSDMRVRVIGAMDHFIPIGHMDDETAARCIRSLEIDVLVDLHGLATTARPNILAYRPAPIQATYLGYPGSTGHPDIDYVIADEYLIPKGAESYYSEKPIRLPTVFQVSDRKRISGPPPTRSSCGLPEKAFIFCSFSNTHKITPEMFGTWMSILRRAPGSVLWLLADNEWAQKNMTLCAEGQGIPASRLVFTGRVLPQDYLARYEVADVFLDTFPFNAGTTANDALWMGLPILTRSGLTFASRMAGSLLRAVGLPQLIAADLGEYADKAVSLAERPGESQAIRRHLMDNRENLPLFSIPKIVHEIEEALIRIVHDL